MLPAGDPTIPTPDDVGAAQTLARLDVIDSKARERLGIVAGAKRILSDEFFIAVMKRLEDEYIGRWRECQQESERERLHVKLEVLDEIKGAFEGCAQGEKTSSKVIDQIAEKRKSLKDKIKHAS